MGESLTQNPQPGEPPAHSAFTRTKRGEIAAI